MRLQLYYLQTRIERGGKFTTENTENTEKKCIRRSVMFEIEETTAIDYSKRPYDSLTKKIIGSAIEVHRSLGPGLLESTYEACLIHELKNTGLQVEWQKPIPIDYKEIKIDCGYRLDILVENAIIIEIKSVNELAKIHESQLLTYLKLSKCKIGILINFNTQILKNGIRRIII